MKISSLSICMISDDFLPAMTGVGTHLKLVAPELARRGHKISIITTRRKGEPAIEHWQGVTIYRVFTVQAYDFYQALPSRKTIRKIFEQIKPDLIHHHYAGLMMMQVCAVAEAMRIQQIATYHFGAEVLTQPFFMRPLRGIVKHLIVYYHNRFGQIMTPSKKAADKLFREGIRTSIVYVSNPVVFSNSTSVLPAQRSESFTVLYAGRLGTEKNISYLIKAFTMLLRKIPEAQLWIAGKGPEESALKKLCEQQQLGNRVQFLGFLDQVTLASYYKACDVFVLPSLQETQSLVVMEAMWFSRPVIMTQAVISAEELIEQGVSGFIVDPGSVEDLAQKLEFLGTHSTARAAMGEASRQRAQNYRVEIILDEIESLYAKLASKKTEAN